MDRLYTTARKENRINSSFDNYLRIEKFIYEQTIGIEIKRSLLATNMKLSLNSNKFTVAKTSENLIRSRSPNLRVISSVGFIISSYCPIP